MRKKLASAGLFLAAIVTIWWAFYQAYFGNYWALFLLLTLWPLLLLSQNVWNKP
jgi:hypothetical protein